MGSNNAEVIFKNRLPIDRRLIANRRKFLDQEYLDHNPERRVDMIGRRMLRDRRGWRWRIMNSFWRKVLLFLHTNLLGSNV
jgi:hypothetical protein